jgi:translocation and assembly module TamA
MDGSKSRSEQLRTWTVLATGLALALACASGCASIPKGQYSVSRIEWRGTQALDSAAIESCLVTRERPRFSIPLGLRNPSCGEPPFDSSPPTIDLWSWPWTDWPVFDAAIFDVERERIERWYRARGYYDARVTDVRAYVDDREVDPNECPGKGAECELKLVVQLHEGAATHVDKVELRTTTALPRALLTRLRANLRLQAGSRLDEADYDADKVALQNALLDASYARVKVKGHVTVDRARRTAYVEYRIEPGPACVFGQLSIEGAQDDVPTQLLIQVASIPRGARYEPAVIDDAQRALVRLNVFSSVRIETRGTGRVVDLVATVQRGPITQLSAGVGLMSGTMVRSFSGTTESVPQWDIHLSGSYENRSFLGGLRRLRIEERPRLIFPQAFPGISGGPRPGNIILVRFEQPGMFEARTKLVIPADWDFGPDPYRGFFRHDIELQVGLERSFWRQRITGRLAIAHDLYIVTEHTQLDDVSSYRLPYLEGQVVLDLRDNPLRPRLGMFFSLLMQGASRLSGYGSWDYARVLPDLRAYVPLPLSMVLAARFALGALFITNPAPDLDPTSKRLGPQSYRLRGGGANSDRGFLAGHLGDSVDGGTRRFEGSLELRVSLGPDFGVVVFGDVGNVSDTGADADGNAYPPSFQFSEIHAATGLGVRYFSVLGALRLDAGWRIPGLQDLNTRDDGIHWSGWPSAVHLTIGEAF